MADQVLTVEETFRLEHLLVTCGDPAVPTATVRLGLPEGETRQDAATGDGPVDAVCKAITRLVDIPNRLSEFSVQSVSAGIDAMGEVSVRVELDEGTFIGRGASTDIVVASARAYLNALNKVAAARRDREAGHPHRSRQPQPPPVSAIPTAAPGRARAGRRLIARPEPAPGLAPSARVDDDHLARNAPARRRRCSRRSGTPTSCARRRASRRCCTSTCTWCTR